MNNNKTYRSGCPEPQLFFPVEIMYDGGAYLVSPKQRTKVGQHALYSVDEESDLSFVVNEPDTPYNEKEETAGDSFEPQYRFFHLIKSHPFQCLERIFENYTLKELQMTWSQWIKCSVCIEFSVFNEGMNRKYLLRFSGNFKVLMEALRHVLTERSKYKKKGTFNIADVSDYYQHLTEKEQAYERIEKFVLNYTEEQVCGYLWNMAECVVDEGKNFDIDRGGILFSYESLLSIARIPYHLVRHYPALFNRSK